MKQYHFSNNDIDLTCEEVGVFLETVGVEKREALRIKLTVEEVLLEYQARFGENAAYKLKYTKRLSAIRVEIEVVGERFNPLENENENSVLINGLLAGIGLAPTHSYKNGKNYIVFTPKKKKMTSNFKMFVAIGLSIIVGSLLTLLPDGARTALSEKFLTPVSDLFFGAIAAVSGPFIFLSVLGSICSMGNMETLGKIGKKTIGAILGYMTVAGLGLTLVATLFYKVTWGGVLGPDFSKILDLVYNIVPTNIFEPFINGNSLQIIFIALIFGIAMLMLSSKVSSIFSIVEQLSALVQTVMGVVLEALPVALFVIFSNMIVSGAISDFIGSYKMILIIVLLVAVYLCAMVLWISLRQKLSPVLLVKKIFPTFLITLTTASSAAAFSTNIKDSNKKLGIDKKLVDFGIPLGQVLFKMSEFAMFIPVVLTFAENNGIAITPAWLILAYITVWLISFAVPPVAGGAIMGFTIVFSQLGIPMEAMGIVIALNAITDFPLTAMNVTGWQLTMIEVADSLGALNKETLHKNLKANVALTK